jgi:hypothetical protein
MATRRVGRRFPLYTLTNIKQETPGKDGWGVNVGLSLLPTAPADPWDEEQMGKVP